MKLEAQGTTRLRMIVSTFDICVNCESFCNPVGSPLFVLFAKSKPHELSQHASSLQHLFANMTFPMLDSLWLSIVLRSISSFVAYRRSHASPFHICANSCSSASYASSNSNLPSPGLVWRLPCIRARRLLRGTRSAV